MTFDDYISILRRSWAWILAATLIGAAAAFGITSLMTPQYQATAQMFVSVRVPVEKGYHFSGDVFVAQRVASYVEVVDSPDVLNPVIAELGLDTTPKELMERIEVKSPTGTVLFDVTATDPDPDQAARLANAIATSYSAEIERLEGAAVAQGGSTPDSAQKPVSVSVVKPAEVPEEPSSPQRLMNVVLGALLGLLAGIGVAVLRHTLDKSVRSQEELEQAVGSACLGAVAFDPSARNEPLASSDGSPRAEEFRRIRTNLQYVDVDVPARAVVVTSSLPDEGRTTAACNLAIALGRTGSKVLLLEGDLRRPRAGQYLGVDAVRGLTDVLMGDADLDSSIVAWEPGMLDFLPSGPVPSNPSELLASHEMKALLDQLRVRYDAIVIDAPPLLLVSDSAVLAGVVDGAILVARHGQTTTEQVAQAARALGQVHAGILGTVLTFLPSSQIKDSRYGQGYENSVNGAGAATTGQRVIDEEAGARR